MEFIVGSLLFWPHSVSMPPEEVFVAGSSLLALNFGQYLPVMITLLVFRGAGIRLMRGKALPGPAEIRHE